MTILNSELKIIPSQGTFKAQVSEVGYYGEAVRYRKLPISGYPCNASFKSAKAVPEIRPDENDQWFSYFPNPANDFLQIKSTRIIRMIEIYDLSGSLLKKIRPLTDDYSVNTSQLQDGVYLCRIFDENNNFENFKIIKQ
jgi:hypothetical protein